MIVVGDDQGTVYTVRIFLKKKKKKRFKKIFNLVSNIK